MSDSKGHFYFCYGSNMSREKLQSRGDKTLPPIQFEDVWIARLSGWSLCFDLRGAPPVEPSMASVRQEPHDEVYGLVYKIKSDRCWEKLLKSEGSTPAGGSGDSYFVIDVDVECYLAQKPEEKFMQSAKTLITNPKFSIPREMQYHVFPSRRYLNIIIGSAEKEGLPDEYVARLKQYPAARPWRRGALVNIMVMVIPFTFLSRRLHIRHLTAPITKAGFFLYAQHEELALSPSRSGVLKMKLLLIRAALFVLYGLYSIPAMIYFLVSPTGRQSSRFVRELLLEKPQNTQKHA